MVIPQYYTNDESLNKCEEPYRSVVQLLDALYMEAPEGCEVLNISSFSLHHVMSAVRSVFERLKNNMLTFNRTLLKCSKDLLASKSWMRYEYFYLTASGHAIFFGAIYYLAAQDTTFSDKHLNLIEKAACPDKTSTALFEYFKNAADQKREELIVNNLSEQVEGEPLPSSKRIVLTNQSETARVVKAMAMSGHFKHEDGSRVSEAEVGRKFCSLFGIKSSWDSLVQSAFKVEGGVAGTFETLKDKAVKHYEKVNKI